MIGKFGLAAALAGAVLFAAPASASAASLPMAGKTLTQKAADTVTPVHRKRWRKWHKHRRHGRLGRYYNYRYYRPRYYSYDPYYYGDSSYYIYRPYHRHYYRRHRPSFGIYLSF